MDSNIALLECPKVNPLPLSWAAIDAAFAAMPGIPLRQAWRQTAECDFRPGLAQIAYREGWICIKAELQDDDVFNPVTGFNELAYKQGDVVEVFAHALGAEHYCEVHSTPAAALLQLRFRVDQPRIPVPGNPVDTPVARALTRMIPGGWSVYLEIPSVLTDIVPQPGARCSMAVCRYDYTRGRANPVLSSTAALTKIDFHDIKEWNAVVFR